MISVLLWCLCNLRNIIILREHNKKTLIGKGQKKVWLLRSPFFRWIAIFYNLFEFKHEQKWETSKRNITNKNLKFVKLKTLSRFISVSKSTFLVSEPCNSDLILTFVNICLFTQIKHKKCTGITQGQAKGDSFLSSEN